MIVCLMPTYREGRLALSAARSALAGCDALIVYEGPVGEAAPGGDPTPLHSIQRLDPHSHTRIWADEGSWGSDAEKRTALLQFAQDLFLDECEEQAEPLWVLWLDGDEILVFGEYLPDLCYRASFEEGVGSLGIRFVELDGSVAKSHCKLVRGDLIDEYMESIYQVRLRGSDMVVALPHVRICVQGGVPCKKSDGTPTTVEDLAMMRPPVHGEPHLLHRPSWRHPERQARRLHLDEPGWYEQRAAEQGIPYF